MRFLHMLQRCGECRLTRKEERRWLLTGSIPVVPDDLEDRSRRGKDPSQLRRKRRESLLSIPRDRRAWKASVSRDSAEE